MQEKLAELRDLGQQKRKEVEKGVLRSQGAILPEEASTAPKGPRDPLRLFKETKAFKVTLQRLFAAAVTCGRDGALTFTLVAQSQKGEGLKKHQGEQPAAHDEYIVGAESAVHAPGKLYGHRPFGARAVPAWRKGLTQI